MSDLIARLEVAAEEGRCPILGHMHVEELLMLEAATEIKRLRKLLEPKLGVLPPTNWDA